MVSYRHIEQETGSSIPQVVERHSWYHLEGQSHKWRSTEKNRISTFREGDPRKKDAITWSCHEKGWSTHFEQALHWEVAGFRRRPERPRMKWRDVVMKDLQRRGGSISSRLTFVASTCGPMHWWRWMNQVKSNNSNNKMKRENTQEMRSCIHPIQFKPIVYSDNSKCIIIEWMICSKNAM